MPFQKGNKCQSAEASRENGRLGGHPVTINPIWRTQFMVSMHKRMLPLCEQILMRCLRHKDIEHNKWATNIVVKKVVPDQFTLDGVDAGTLASLIEGASKNKVTESDENRPLVIRRKKK